MKLAIPNLVSLFLHPRRGTPIRAGVVSQHDCPSLLRSFAGATLWDRSTRCQCAGQQCRLDIYSYWTPLCTPPWGPANQALPQDILPVSCRICTRPEQRSFAGSQCSHMQRTRPVVAKATSGRQRAQQ
ncbi:hypothetical protein CC77DRAFT_544016 [Alternaria alternata]|uniref:Uncharacterized protein n=1 Tax=Alternaria alternata TaxID=5599 RepID=A0A177DYI1_ALTAL|nr:hypothetical protein CC77DRAFT_544016 [Alternaria alternata]OAG24774.1 hypothetical protein CC77DRAFT_544016 [Alternaria alternata]